MLNTIYKSKKTKSPYQIRSTSANNSNIIDKESMNHNSSGLIDSSDDSTNCFNPKLAPVAASNEVIDLLDSNDDKTSNSSDVYYYDDDEEYQFTQTKSFYFKVP